MIRSNVILIVPCFLLWIFLAALLPVLDSPATHKTLKKVANVHALAKSYTKSNQNNLIPKALVISQIPRPQTPLPVKNIPSYNPYHQILVNAATHNGLRPSFVLAVSLWESGWNQNARSSVGAIGLMQIMPATADGEGLKLLGRKVNLLDATDNAEMGAALLRKYLDDLGGWQLALAAYYQGENGTILYGIYPSSWRYINGIWDIRCRLMLTEG